MRLIITEEQLNKLTNKVRQAIEKYGFIEASEVMGINKLKLAKMSGLLIKGDIRDSRFTDDDEIVVSDLLFDLVKKDDKYKTCSLEYHRDGVLTWECRFKDDENYYFVGVDATPYWEAENIMPVHITSIVITPIHSPEDKKKYDTFTYSDEFDCPETFENADELINWFENEYKPKTYDKIVEMLGKFKASKL